MPKPDINSPQSPVLSSSAGFYLEGIPRFQLKFNGGEAGLFPVEDGELVKWADCQKLLLHHDKGIEVLKALMAAVRQEDIHQIKAGVREAAMYLALDADSRSDEGSVDSSD